MALEYDQIAKDLTQTPAGTLAPKEGAVFQGYLGPGLTKGQHRLYLSPRHDEWLELVDDDILSQLPGSKNANGASFVWVKPANKIVKCRRATAEGHADAIAEAEADGNSAGYRPKW